jgi:DmsE family decaheme c-type cytochrome
MGSVRRLVVGALCVAGAALAGARPAFAQADTGYAGSAVCVQCHRSQVDAFQGTRMGHLFLADPRDSVEDKGCEGCHGPARQHVESGGEERGGLISYAANSPTPVADRNALCLRCHEESNRLLWPGSTHDREDLACTNCHTIMKNVSERAQLKAADVTQTCAQCHMQRKAQQLQASHMPLGVGTTNAMGCTSCHNPHGSANEKLLVAPTVNDVCFTCHADKRGPFLWEHAPVTENCANCHNPHGSNNEQMLKVPKPRLCQQCHLGTGHPNRPYSTDPSFTKYIDGRQCVNCHTMIHGSNHPSGVAFTR